MSKANIFRSKTLVMVLAASFVLLTLPVRDFAAGAPKATGALAGHIFNEDMKTPVHNAVVKLRSVDGQKVYESKPTDLEGMYTIPAIEEGRYVMGVMSVRGDYNFYYSILIKSDALAKLSVALAPGAGAQTAGEAATKKKGFFNSPAGIMTLIAVAGATLFAVVLIEGETSPIK